MRIAVIFAAMLLCACATKPGDSVLYYKGVYAPGSIQIAADGAFIARASVWNAAKLELAGEAALYRLEQAARERGYSHFMLDGSHGESNRGHQYVLNGTVYRQADAPFGALPISEMRHALITDQADGPQVAAVAPPAQRNPEPIKQSPRRMPQSVIEEELPPDEEPLVIEAPEFITMKPTKRPWG